MKRNAMVLALLMLAGCATNAVISDLEQDKVIVQATGNDQAVIDAKAREGCALHGRKPVAVSYRCLDGWCTQKEFLYACQE